MINRLSRPSATWAADGISSNFVFLPQIASGATTVRNFGNIGQENWNVIDGGGDFDDAAPYMRGSAGATANRIYNSADSAQVTQMCDIFANAIDGIGGGVFLFSALMKMPTVVSDAFVRPFFYVGSSSATPVNGYGWGIGLAAPTSSTAAIQFWKKNGTGNPTRTNIGTITFPTDSTEHRLTLLIDAYGGNVTLWRDDTIEEGTSAIVSLLDTWAGGANALVNQIVGMTLFGEAVAPNPGARGSSPNWFEGDMRDILVMRLDSQRDTIDGVKSTMQAALLDAPVGTIPRWFEGK